MMWTSTPTSRVENFTHVLSCPVSLCLSMKTSQKITVWMLWMEVMRKLKSSRTLFATGFYGIIIKDLLTRQDLNLNCLFQSNRHVYIVQKMLWSRSGLLDPDLDNSLSKYKKGWHCFEGKADQLVLVPKWHLAREGRSEF